MTATADLTKLTAHYLIAFSCDFSSTLTIRISYFQVAATSAGFSWWPSAMDTTLGASSFAPPSPTRPQRIPPYGWQWTTSATRCTWSMWHWWNRSWCICTKVSGSTTPLRPGAITGRSCNTRCAFTDLPELLDALDTKVYVYYSIHCWAESSPLDFRFSLFTAISRPSFGNAPKWTHRLRLGPPRHQSFNQQYVCDHFQIHFDEIDISQ